MAAHHLIDTTEMYLKTIAEMEEDGVVPLRARIVERLGHSGPTVSQTVARMERDGLLTVRDDRRLELSVRGRSIATEVMRKHRLAERLLVDVIGLDWVAAHDEACRWEHVMSDAVETRLENLLQRPTLDPYGNPIPGAASPSPDEQSVGELAAALEAFPPATAPTVTLTRIGEPVQAEPWFLAELQAASLLPGRPITVAALGDGIELRAQPGTSPDSETAAGAVGDGESDAAGGTVVLPKNLGPHLFVRVSD